MMNHPSDIIAQSYLIERLVLDRQTTEKMGVFDQFWIDPQSHQVQGLICKSGLLNHHKKYFTWQQIQSIGSDSILVQSSAVDLPKISKSCLIVGHELWTDQGNKVGKIVDFLINLETGAIPGYLFVKEGWKGALLEGIYQLSPVGISTVGEKRVIALQSAIEQAEHYQAGLGYKFEKALNFVQEDYSKTKHNLAATVDKTKEVATRLKDAAQLVTESLKNVDQDVLSSKSEDSVDVEKTQDL